LVLVGKHEELTITPRLRDPEKEAQCLGIRVCELGNDVANSLSWLNRNPGGREGMGIQCISHCISTGLFPL